MTTTRPSRPGPGPTPDPVGPPPQTGPISQTGPTAQMGLTTQLTRFVLTGGLSAAVDFGLLVAGMALGLGHTPAKAISFVAGTTTAYLINRRWTFAADPSRRRFLAVLALYATTFVLQVGLFALLYPPLDERWGERVAQVVGFIIAQGVATAVNFVVQRLFIFRRP